MISTIDIALLYQHQEMKTLSVIDFNKKKLILCYIDSSLESLIQLGQPANHFYPVWLSQLFIRPPLFGSPN